MVSRRAGALGVQTATEAPNGSGDSQWPRTSTMSRPGTMRSCGQPGSGSKTPWSYGFGSKGLKAGDLAAFGKSMKLARTVGGVLRPQRKAGVIVLRSRAGMSRHRLALTVQTARHAKIPTPRGWRACSRGCVVAKETAGVIWGLIDNGLCHESPVLGR